MPTIAVPRRRLTSLQDLAVRVLERHAMGSEGDLLARDLLSAFPEMCRQLGLDSVLAQLEEQHAPLDLSDALAFADDPRFRAPLVTRLGTKGEFDPKGPRNAKPRQLAEIVIATLGLQLVDDEDHSVALPDVVRVEVSTAMTTAAEDALGSDLKDFIISHARAAVEERHQPSFERIAENLDDRGLRILKQPKIPIDALHAIQRALFDAKLAAVAKAASIAIDRAVEIIGKADAAVAARIDAPVSLKLTPRDVAILRAKDSRIPVTAIAIAHSVLETLTDLAQIQWLAVELPVRPYAASQTFAVGELVEHPKFGIGKVLTVAIKRIEVEFPDGKTTLVHARQ